jgi:hypothetical protein
MGSSFRWNDELELVQTFHELSAGAALLASRRRRHAGAGGLD